MMEEQQQKVEAEQQQKVEADAYQKKCSQIFLRSSHCNGVCKSQYRRTTISQKESKRKMTRKHLEKRR